MPWGKAFAGKLLVCWLGCLWGLEAAAQTPAPLKLCEGHQKAIYAVGYSPDGKYAYTGSLDRTVKIWDRQTWLPLRTLGEHQNGVLALALSKDGRQLATAGLDRRIFLYDNPLRDSLANWSGFPGDPTGLVFLPDGASFFTVDKGRLLRLWNATNGQAIRDFQGVTGELLAVLLSPDAKQVAALSADGFVRVWLIETGAPLGYFVAPGATHLIHDGEQQHLIAASADGTIRIAGWPTQLPTNLPGHSQALTGLMWVKGGQQVLTSSLDHTLRLFDVKEGKEIRNFPPDQGSPIQSLSARDDLSLVVSGAADGKIRTWDAEGKFVRGLLGHTGPVTAVSVSPDGKEIASGGQDGTLRVWSPPTVAPVAYTGHSQPVFAVAVGTSEKVAVTLSGDKQLLVHDLTEQKPPRNLASLQQPPTALALSPDESLVATAEQGGIIRLWAVADGKTQGEFLAHTTTVTGLKFFQDNKRLATTGADGQVRLWQLPLVAPRTVETRGEPITVLVTTPKQTGLLTAANDKTLQLVDPATGKPERVYEGITAPVSSADWAPDGTGFVVGQVDGWLRQYATGTAQPAATVFGHPGVVSSVAVAPGQKLIATAGPDGLIRLWDYPLRSGLTLAGHTQAVSVVAVSGDGKLIATSGADQTIRLWQTTDGKSVAELKGHTQPITTLAFRADHQSLASGDNGGEIRLWKVAGGAATHVLAAHPGGVTGVGFHPTQPHLYSTGADGAVRSWVIGPPATLHTTPHEQEVKAIVVTADGQWSLSGTAGGILRIEQVADGKAVGPGARLPAGINSLAVTADKSQAVAALADGSVQILKLPEGTVQGTLKVEGVPQLAVALRGPGPQLATAGQDGQIRLWQLPLGDNPMPVQTLMGHSGPVHAITFNPSGDRLISGGSDKTVRSWNPQDGAAGPQYASAGDAVYAVAVSGDGTKVFASGADKQIRVWNLADAAAVAEWTAPHVVRSLSTVADGSRVVSACDDGFLRIWDVPTKYLLQQLPGHAGAIWSVSWTPDGQKLVSGGSDKTTRVWPVSILKAWAGHAGRSNSLALTVDGSGILTGGEDKLVKLWDVNGQAVRQFAGIQAAVTQVTVRADSAVVAATGADNTVQLWNYGDGNPLADLPRIPVPTAVTGLQFSPDKQHIAIATADQRVRIFRFPDGKLLQDFPLESPGQGVAWTTDGKSVVVGQADKSARVLPVGAVRLCAGHEGNVQSLVFSGKGDVLLSSGADKSVRFWNPVDGTQIRAHAGMADVVLQLAASADGQFVAGACADKQLRCWRVADGGEAWAWPHPAVVRACRFSPDGTQVLTTCDDSLVRIWDVAAGKELQVFPGHVGVIPQGGWTSNGKLIVTGGADKTVRGWTLAATKVWSGHPMRGTALALTPDNNHVITFGDDKIAKIWDLKGQLVRSCGGGQTVLRTLEVRKDGLQFAGGNDEQVADKGLYLWDFATGNLQQRIETPAGITGLAYRADQNQIAVAQADNFLRTYRVDLPLLYEAVQTDAAPTCLAYLAKGQSLIAGQGNNQARAYPLAAQQVWTAHEGAIHSLVWHKAGKFLVTGSADKRVRVWQAATGQQAQELTGSAEQVLQVELAPDGNSVWATTADKQVHSWPLKLPEKAPAQPAAVAVARSLVQPVVMRSLALSADGKRLATAGDDQLVHLWDLATGIELERCAGHTNTVNRVAFGADGRTLATAAADNTAKVWSLQVQQGQEVSKQAVTALASVPGQPEFVVAFADKSVAIWPLTLEKATRALPGAAEPLRQLAVAPDGKTILGTGDDKHLRVWARENGAAVLAQPLPAAGTSLALAEGGLRVLVGCADGLLRAYGLQNQNNKWTAELLQEMAGQTGPVTAVAFTPDERQAVSLSNDRSWRRWQTSARGPRLELLGHTAPIYGLDFTPDGKLLVSAGGDHSVRVWTTDDGKQRNECQGHKGQVFAVTVQPQGTAFASTGADRTIRIWKTEDASPVKTIEDGLNDACYTLQFYADGNWLLAGGLTKTWQFWNVAEGKSNREAVGHTDYLLKAVFNPAWNRVASVDYSGHLIIWDTGSATVIHRQQLPTAAAYSVAYAPDGKELLIGTQDARLMVIQIPQNAW